MKSSLPCLPCFLQQTIKAASLSTDDTNLQKEILNTIARLLPGLDLEKSPPENSIPVYETIARLSGCSDPFLSLKDQSNNFALGLMAEINKSITESPDPIFTAIIFSIAGNIIDYGSQQDFDAEQAIRKCLTSPLAINDYTKLRQDLEMSSRILYLGDNAGEIIFDRLVIETIQHLLPGKEITFVVKENPIINDALLKDAHDCGLTNLCRVISNGTGCPGTPLSSCPKEFQDIFADADLILSKGQGNYETLSEVTAPLYFLLTVKCPIVGSHIYQQSNISVNKGELVLMKGSGIL
ncbi:MAG: ARMT1-like domain-containing protein [Thermodesulfobacteriota bacterium]